MYNVVYKMTEKKESYDISFNTVINNFYSFIILLITLNIIVYTY